LICGSLLARVCRRHPRNVLYRMMFRAQNLAVQGGLSCLAVTVSARAGNLLVRAGRKRDVIAEEPALGDYVTEGIDHHRAAILELVVIHADGVGKDNVNAIVIGPGRQPLHQPAPALETVELGAQRGWIGVAVLPQNGIDAPSTGPSR